ncbi:MAG: class I SAM-dependent methyltransferase [Myxococcota bacterium]
MSTEDDLRANHAWWEERAALHADTPMYAPWIAALRRGEPALFPLERQLVGDPAGLRLLHVPCHIGHDTLSWALLGAEVTGVDFSETALREARTLSDALGLRATWVHADAAALPPDMEGVFDCVVSTYGAYGWMPDLAVWAAGIARVLAPGGRFVLVDGHPVGLGLDGEAALRGEYRIADPLMGGSRVEDDRTGTYADRSLRTRHNRAVGWCHGVGDLLSALLGAGLAIEHYAEHAWCVWQATPNMVERDGVFVLPDAAHGTLPFLLSVVARKPSA